VAADLQTLSGGAPWLVEGDDKLVRVFLSTTGKSTLAFLDGRTGKPRSRVDEGDEGFAAALWEVGGTVAAARAHQGALSVRSWDRSAKPLVTLRVSVVQPPVEYLGPSWMQRGVHDASLGADGSLGLIVGEGGGRLHVERWTAGGERQATATLVDGLTEPIIARQTPGGGTLAVLRGSKGWPRYPTTDLWTCVVAPGSTPSGECSAVGLAALTGERPGPAQVVASAATADGGLVLATQAVKDIYGEHSITRRRGDTLLVRLRADGSTAWTRVVPFKTRSGLSPTEHRLTSPVSLVVDGERLVMVTAVQGTGWNQAWSIEARPLDPATGEPGPVFAAHETRNLPVTSSLDCAGARCSLNEVVPGAGGGAQTVVFEGGGA
jgi:hypothetical protein